ncbi:hypothetical protein ACI797_10005 [Geodermatophilus sp. SYSU D00691]
MRLHRGAAVLAATVLLAGCTSFADDEGDGGGSGEARATTTAPAEELTVVADDDPVAAAVSTSRALYGSADVVVIAREGDDAGTLLGASAAVGLGVPLLLERAGGAVDDGLAAEVDRLGAATVLAVGEAEGSALGSATEEDGAEVTRETIAVPADPEAVAAAGVPLGGTEEVALDDAVAAVAAMDPEQPAALLPEGAGTAGTDDAPAELPEVARADPLEDVVVLAVGGPEDVAGAATARAAGAQVVVTGGSADPRASADVVDAVSEHDGGVLALGAGFAAEDGLDWKLATARSGVQLPGGGQTLFPGRMLVALYGSPGTGALGVLGEQDVDASVERAREHAAPYEDLVDRPVVPAFEIIVTVASSVPGPDGNYSTELDLETIRPWVEAAGEAGVYVFLDLQPGRTDFLTQAQAYQPLLELPHVGLALDPEWRLGPDGVHLQTIGSVGVDEVNAVIAWLADLTRERQLPQKLLVVHQFQLRMITDRQRLDLSRDEVAVTIHADGQGAQGDKQATWNALHQDLPPGPLFWGWKNFYDEDLPMLTPEQTVASVSPVPDLVSYQ